MPTHDESKAYPAHLFLLLAGTLLLWSACSDMPTDSGGGTTPGIPEPAFQEFPRWSPDGKRILYYDFGIVRYDPETRQAQHDPAQRGIWLMDVDSGEKRKLLSAGYADWSPDGSSVVFEAGAQIYTARIAGETVDSSSVVQLTPGGRNFFPAWSPDGEWVIHDRSIADDFGPSGIWMVKLDGTEWQHAFGGVLPAWHPDGKRVLAVIGVSATSIETRFVQHYISDTALPDTIVAGRERDNMYPRYSPDGRRIVFQSDWQVWVMGADGRDSKPLTFDQGGMPDWSPDGRRIVYIGPGNTVWLMDSEGQNRRQLTFRPGP